MASGPITSRLTDEERSEAMTDAWQALSPWAPRRLRTVTAAMKLKDACPSGEKLDSVLKTRDVTLPTNVHLAKAMVFPVVMYGCESWTIKKAEHRRIDAFELGLGEDS